MPNQDTIHGTNLDGFVCHGVIDGGMLRSRFVAAQSSRHRTAALALYRALLRTAGRIPLPQDVQRPGPRDLVRRRFAKNASDASYRLVYAAMTAGYKFLSLLSKASIPDSPEHAQVVNHLRETSAVSHASRAARPQRARKPILPPEPLLVNVAERAEPPKYASNILPRPRSSLPAERKVPSLCATADGQPFVRIYKPQPRALSRMVGRKGRIFANRIIDIMHADEELVPQARLEDQWDQLMDDLMRREVGPKGDPRPAPESTFAWSVQLSRLWIESKIEGTWEDWIARGDALHKLVEEERALKLGEESGDEAMKSDAVPSYKGQGPRFPLSTALRKAKATYHEEDAADPFATRAWAALVRSESPRMLRWMKYASSAKNLGPVPTDLPWRTSLKQTKTQPPSKEA